MSTAPGLLLSGLSAADPPGGLTYPLALRRDDGANVSQGSSPTGG